ncbi:uncharacterized protein [Choristoneura fumiferana]|uniref:uncharacterized protein n=1 Tax=Choristoneura fumiferana TaxID=7141 RepID=UPI003D155744
MRNYFKRFVECYSQTVGERTEVDKMMSITFIIQSAFWHNVLDPQWTWKRYYIHQLLNLALVVYVFFGTMEIITSATDFQIIAEAYYTIILIGTCPVKLLIFINNRFAFRKLYIITKTTFYDFIRNDSEERLAEVIKTGTKVVNTLFFLVTIPFITYELIALFNYVKGTRILLSRSTSTLMPMSTPYYEIAYVLHSIFMSEMSAIMIVMDMCFVFLLFFLCVASESLAKVLDVEPKRNGESDLSYGERLNEALRRFYVAHLDHVEYLSTLNQMYKWLALAPLCNAALCVCLALVVMSKEVNWHFGTLFLPLFAEIFAYSWFGAQLKTKTSSIRMALLNFDWTNLNLRDKKSYYIITLYMAKEFGVRTAIGHDLSLITMTSVLKFSYQAFTVLQTIE